MSLSKSNLSVRRTSDIVQVLQWSDFCFWMQAFLWFHFSKWMMQCWTYQIFLKTEKCEFIVLLNACIFWQVRRDLVNEELERTVLIQTWTVWIHWLCLGLQLRPFHQSSHRHKWWLCSKPNPLERWDIFILPSKCNEQTCHRAQMGCILAAHLIQQSWSHGGRSSNWPVGSFIHAAYILGGLFCGVF